MKANDLMGKRSRLKKEFYNPDYFIDRELSWLKFNDRVLEEAEDSSHPLLERLKFLGIVSSNLDEFLMVRVSGIQDQVEAGVRSKNPAGFTPTKLFEKVHLEIHDQVARQYQCFQNELLPALNSEKIEIKKPAQLTRAQRKFVREYFDSEIFPTLTPLGVDSGHPFPFIRNLSLNVVVELKPRKGARNSDPLFALVEIPQKTDRIIQAPSKDGCYTFVLLEDLVAEEIHLLFPGMTVIQTAAFRLVRDADIEFAEEEADDLLKTIEEELRSRERGNAVGLFIDQNAGSELIDFLSRNLRIGPQIIYSVDGPQNLSDVAKIGSQVNRPELKDEPFTPSVREPIRSSPSIFNVISQQDILLHHPYEAFSPVEEFVQQAARDPNVLAIKQTLYRTSGNSPITRALMEAAEEGKQVAALVELKARFDEERNIEWAKKMEKGGVHVVYGLVGLKTHAKVCLVVRREEGGIRRYVHLGTGNYNPTTARLYTDIGLLTCDPDLCDDATELFNQLTGYSRISDWRKVIVAPQGLRPALHELIQEQIQLAKAKKPASIRAKMNSLVDPEIICHLYEASQAGVKIDLIIRGICCLRPGIPGISENITVSSIVDRFLEHSRIFIFGQGKAAKVYLSSADWMQRNLDRRVETIFPVEDEKLKHRVVDEVFNIGLRDNVKRRVLKSDGSYVRVRRSSRNRLRSQEDLLRIERLRREEAEQTALKASLLPRVQGDQSKSKPLPPIVPAARKGKAQGELIQLTEEKEKPARKQPKRKPAQKKPASKARSTAKKSTRGKAPAKKAADKRTPDKKAPQPKGETSQNGSSHPAPSPATEPKTSEES